MGLAFIAVGFVFASQRLVVYSRAFLLEAAVYILLQVAGWVLVIEWLRITGYLTVRADGEH